MATTQLNTKIKLRYDTLENWLKTNVVGKGGNLVLLKGEVAFCEVPAATIANKTIDTNGASTVDGVTANNMPTIIFKVGDGTHAFKDLNWGSALAADVYAWAKKAYAETGDGMRVTGFTAPVEGDGHADLTTKNNTTLNSVLQDIYDQFNTLNGGTGSIGDQIKAALAGLVNTAAQQTSGTVGGNDDTKYVKGITIESDANGVKRLKLVEGTLPTVVGADATISNAMTDNDGDTVVTSVTQDKGRIAVTKQSLGLGTAARADVSSGGIVDGADATGENTYNGDLVTAAQVATYVKARTAALTGATHFKGALTVSQNETAADVLTAISNPAAGDIYLVGTAEYIYNDDADNSGANAGWVLLGDEGIYATQTALAGKVDKINGYSLLADTEITRLAGIETGAEVNDVTDVTVGGTSVVDGSTKVAALGAMAGKTKVAYTDLESTLAADIDGKLDGVNAGIATVDNNDIVTIKGGLDVDRNTTPGTNTVVNTASTNDITLAKVAKTGLITDLDLGDGLILDGGNAEIPAQTQEEP